MESAEDVNRAGILSLLMTSSNLLVLIVINGHEIAWICLTACSVDICGNCLVMFWLTLPKFRHATQYTTGAPTSAPTVIRAAKSTKTYQLDTLFGLSASSSVPTTGTTSTEGRTGDSVHGPRKQEKNGSTGGAPGHQQEADRPIDPEIEPLRSEDGQLHCQDDIDLALTMHPIGDKEVSTYDNTRV